MNESAQAHTPTVRDYMQVVQRRKWAILVAILLFPLAAVGYSYTQVPAYRASAEVLLTRQNLAASLNGISDTSQNNQPERLPLTQAGVASVPTLAARVLAALHIRGETPAQFLSRSSVAPKNNTDLLVFSVTDRDPVQAERLASEYARQFTIYRKQLDTGALERARAGLETQLTALRQSPNTNPTLYANLVSKDQEIRAMEALQTGNTAVVRTADSAKRVRPKPIRNAVLSLGIGLIIGILLAFAREGLDTRVRSIDELAHVLRLPELGRVPSVKRRGRRERPEIAMISAPNNPEAEAMRVLRTRVELANLDRGARAIMITSPLAGDGKSTTAANLAVAFARTGKRVILVDLDLHRPIVHHFFGVPSSPGLTDVAVGHADLGAALVPVAVADGAGDENGHASLLGPRASGVVQVLPSGPLPPVPAEFVGSHAVAAILDELRSRADLVIVDAPSLLGTSVSVTLSECVDALILVLRVNAVPGRALKAVHRILEGSRAPTLGFVAIGVEPEPEYQPSHYDVGYAPEANGGSKRSGATLVAIRRSADADAAGTGNDE
jgi:polysaccharide biosynthesis transport protein